VGRALKTSVELLDHFKAWVEKDFTEEDRELVGLMAEEEVSQFERLNRIHKHVETTRFNDAWMRKVQGIKIDPGYETDPKRLKEITDKLGDAVALNNSLIFSHHGRHPDQVYYNLDNLSDYITVVVPQVQMIIRVEMIGLRAYFNNAKDRSGKLLGLRTYVLRNDKWSSVYSAFIVSTYYPKFCVVCDKVESCKVCNKKAIKIVENDAEFIIENMCFIMAGKNSMCPRMADMRKEYGLEILDLFAINNECMLRWEWRNKKDKQPKAAKKPIEEDDIAVIEEEVSEQPKAGDVIIVRMFREVYLSKHKAYVRELRKRGIQVQERCKPKEHERRAHERKYKNGKVIIIGKQTINKGHLGKAVYKIT
jgi:hypothetical protein